MNTTVRHVASSGFALLIGSLRILAAEYTLTPTLASDYDFRGVTQTNNAPAMQLSVDYKQCQF